MVLYFALATSGCGVFAMQRQVDELGAKHEALERDVQKSRAQSAALRGELDATRQRLDNALRANADASSDVASEKTRSQQLIGRIDELAQALEELKKQVASSRTEIDARLDEMKRAQEVQATKPPPVVIPTDKAAHLRAVQNAHGQKDWNLTRTFGREYLSRYASDERTDEVLFLMGDADLKDGRPSAALGQFNRLLKQFPTTKFLDRALFDMGEAYLMLHDCPNARLAFSACVSRFGKEQIGADAKRKLALIARPPEGLCAPQ